ncbi:hypothetical protein [Nostoc commune]|uniref:hypothetical protein n=1 Tax=Nostoc commune TaxID=1178 RepID=UPI0018C80574|nr:hypothetical protein [Nostoc commune]MBG1263757.1 hypothetical protein [Nostoc commune BAE]
MKNKFLALAAFGAATLGGAILSAPASAQIAQGSGPTSTINVSVSVPEILYLRTVQNAAIDISAAELVGGAATLTAITGTTPPASIGNDQTTGPAGTPISTTSPFTLAAAPVTKIISNAYIVWSNSPTGTYTVDITPGSFTDANSNILTVDVSGSDASSTTQAATGLTTGNVQNIDLDVTLDATGKAGSYTGVLTVEAYRPN